MSEKLNSFKSNQAIDCMKRWMELDLEQMSDTDHFAAFYGYCEMLAEEIESTQGIDLSIIKNKLNNMLGTYKELMDIRYPDAMSGLFTEESYFDPLERVSMRNEPIILEININKLMIEFKEIAERLIELHKDDESPDKVYDFKILGEDVEQLLEGTVGEIESLSTIPADIEVDRLIFRNLYDQASILLHILIDRGKLIGLSQDDTDKFLDMITAVEDVLFDAAIDQAQLRGGYKEMSKVAQTFLDRIKITPEELAANEAERAEFNDIGIGSTLGAVVEGIRDKLMGAMVLIKGDKPKDPSQSN
jgi:hypothetical protein